jgi:hypothetical protein
VARFLFMVGVIAGWSNNRKTAVYLLTGHKTALRIAPPFAGVLLPLRIGSSLKQTIGVWFTCRINALEFA